MTRAWAPESHRRPCGDQHDIDELARMERLCLDLAEASALPLERAGLPSIASNYRRAILAARPAIDLPTQCLYVGFLSDQIFGVRY